MRVAVVSAVCNEEAGIARLLDALLTQTRPPDEIVITDDGSRDRTCDILNKYSHQYSHIQTLFQENQGPASARNRAWKATSSDICIFTDGDCLPNPDWIETLIKGFSGEDVGAVAGTYRTLNNKNLLAAFIGLEIEWRYASVRGEVDVHGAYNLAIRRSVLEEVGGFDEIYTQPSGEDWDLTYKISRRHRIMFEPKAIVGHSHPEQLFPYLKLQARRGYDRMRLYNAHADKRHCDVYTGAIVKYQVMAAGLFLPSLLLACPCLKGGYLVPLGLFLFLLGTAFISFPFMAKKNLTTAFYGILLQFVRNFAWFVGGLIGLIQFGVKFRPSREPA